MEPRTFVWPMAYALSAMIIRKRVERCGFYS
jgi:hypothetical protein